jgi:hypothetical protein
MNLILDLDGTLIARYPSSGDDFAPRPLADPARIRELGLPVAIASNQGGIPWGLAGGREGRRYPDWPAVLERVRFGMRLAGVRWAFLALHHPEARLPEGEALLQAAKQIRLPAPIALAARSPRVAPMIRVPEGFVVASWNPGLAQARPGDAGLRPGDPDGGRGGRAVGLRRRRGGRPPRRRGGRDGLHPGRADPGRMSASPP